MASHAMCLLHVLADHVRTPTRILSTRHRLEMVRIHAKRDLAQMVQLKTLWNFTDHQFIDHAMSKPALSLQPCLSVEILASSCSRPNPASAHWLWADFVEPRSRQRQDGAGQRAPILRVRHLRARIDLTHEECP